MHSTHTLSYKHLMLFFVLLFALSSRGAMLVKIEITGDDTIPEKSSAEYSCLAIYDTGKTVVITPKWKLSSTEYASLSGNTVTNTTTDSAWHSVELQASYGGKQSSKSLSLAPVTSGDTWLWLTLKPQWHPYALHFIPDESSVRKLQEYGQAWFWGSDNWENQDSFAAVGQGQGFMLYAEKEQKILLNGTPGEHSYELKSGWNLVTPRAYNFPEDKEYYVVDKNASTYTLAGTSEPGEAVWVNLVTSAVNIDGTPEERLELSQVSITPAVKEGYVFHNWTVKGVETEDDTANPLVFTMPDHDVYITTNYHKLSLLTVDGVAEQKEEGVQISLDAPSKDDYIFSEWTVEGVTVADKSANPLVFTMPANDVTLTSNFVAWEDVLYVVIDLSSGKTATQYPVRYATAGPDLTKDLCRTTELWLRRIPAGTFYMGSPTTEVGRYPSEEVKHKVTLTKDYYIGVFEITQKQYELVTGDKPSLHPGDTRPVENLSYRDLRGTIGCTNWPSKGNEVAEESFLGILRKKAGLTVDLPTEAQWEYACRANTTTALNTNEDLTNIVQDPAMDKAGRYAYDLSEGVGGYTEQHTQVGYYPPNNWMLYDMHGNVYEWCLDWYADFTSAEETDPVGPDTGKDRVLRGGDWNCNSRDCRSANRNWGALDHSSYGSGFRIACPPPPLPKQEE